MITPASISGDRRLTPIIPSVRNAIATPPFATLEEAMQWFASCYEAAVANHQGKHHQMPLPIGPADPAEMEKCLLLLINGGALGSRHTLAMNGLYRGADPALDRASRRSYIRARAEIAAILIPMLRRKGILSAPS